MQYTAAAPHQVIEWSSVGDSSPRLSICRLLVDEQVTVDELSAAVQILWKRHESFNSRLTLLHGRVRPVLELQATQAPIVQILDGVAKLEVDEASLQTAVEQSQITADWLGDVHIQPSLGNPTVVLLRHRAEIVDPESWLVLRDELAQILTGGSLVDYIDFSDFTGWIEEQAGNFSVDKEPVFPNSTTSEYLPLADTSPSIRKHDTLLGGWIGTLNRFFPTANTISVDISKSVRSLVDGEFKSGIGTYRVPQRIDVELSAEATFKSLLQSVTDTLAGLDADSLAIPTTIPEAGFACITIDKPRQGPVVIDAIEWSPGRSPVVFVCTMLGDSLSARVHFDANRIDPQTADALQTGFSQLTIHGLAADSTLLSELALSGSGFVPPVATGPENADWHGSFLSKIEAIAVSHPQAIAIRNLGDGSSINFAKLNSRAELLASAIASRGVTNGDVVALALPRSAEFVVALLATAKCNAVFMPLDLNSPEARLISLLEQVETSLVIAYPETSETFARTGVQFLDYSDKDIWSNGSSLPARTASAAKPEDIVYILHTSGSTGLPKPVELLHGGLSNYLNFTAHRYNLREGDGAIVQSPVTFDLTLTSLLAPLCEGQRITIIPENQDAAGSASEVEDVVSLLMEGNLTLLKTTPSYLRLINTLLPKDKFSDALKTIVVGGEVLPYPVVEPWLNSARPPRIFNEYGPTETVVGCACCEISGPWPANELAPIGGPIDNTILTVRDRNGNILPYGAVGELWIGGRGVGRGYRNRPEETGAQFLFDSDTQSRTYRTGDKARMRSDNTLDHLGRIDEQLKVNGIRIDPGEVERCMEGAAGVLSAVLVKISLDTGGDSTVLFVSSCEGDALSIDLLEQHARDHLPPALIPSRMVVLDELPVTGNGKIDRAALARTAHDVGNEQERVIEPPSGPIEERLTEVFCAVLGLKTVGVTEEFFNLGGDSIRSISIVGKAAQLGIQFSVADLFSRRTIRELSKHAQSAASGQEARTDDQPFELIKVSDRQKLPAGVCDAYPTSQLQTAMIFHNELEREHAVYHDVFSYRLEFSPDFYILQSAARLLVERHDALRTTFSIGKYSEPLQMVHSQGESILAVEDLSPCSAEEQKERIEKSFHQERLHTFDIEKLPLVRLLAQRLDSTMVQLTMSFHHAIIDGWSDVSLMMEFFSIYHALKNGLPLPSLPEASYQEFIRLEQQAIASPEAREFWRSYLAGSPEGLLKEGNIVPTAGDEVRVLQVPVSNENSARLHALCTRESLPMKSVLFAVHSKVISEVIGKPDCLTSMVMSGRPEKTDGQRVIGMFINSVPLRIKLGSESWVDLAYQALVTESEVLPHRRLPLSEIQDINRGGRLSDSLYYFTHYHIASNLQDYDVEMHELRGHEASSFKLAANFSVNPFDDSVKLTVAAKGDAIPLSQHERIVELYSRAIAAMANDPNSTHKDLAGVLASGDVDASKPVTSTIISDLLSLTKKHPDSIAIVSGARSITYAELDELSVRVAARLRLYASPGDRVAIFSQRNEDFIIALVGVLRAGTVYLPIDVSNPEARRDLILNDAKPALAIGSASYATDLCPSVTFDALTAPLPGAQFGLDSIDDTNLKSPAYLIYTSGSTGKPKGVLVSHQALSSMFDATSALLGASGGNWLWLTGAGFDISILELLYPLATGGSVVIHSDVRNLLPRAQPLSATGPDFSLFFFASQLDSQPYDLLVNAAKRADELGFKAIWTPERHFHRFGGAFPNPSITSAALATITKRLELRAGSLVLPLHDPIRVAEDWAMIDNLSGGRAGISFASGWNRNDFLIAHGGPAAYDERHASMYENTELIRELWKGSAVSFDRGEGKQSVSITPLPIQKNIPIWLSAAGSPRTFTSAGKIGAGILTHLMSQDRDLLLENITHYRNASSHEGCVSLMLHTFVGESSEQAVAVASPPLSEYLFSSADLARGIFGVEIDSLVAEDLKHVVAGKLDYYLKQSSLIGSVDECVERARQLVELGVDEFACLIDFGVSSHEVLQGIDRLDQVRAALSKVSAVPADQSVAALCARNNVTHLQCTPTVLRELLSDKSTRSALENLHTLLVGGERLPESVAADLLALRSNRSFNMYGPTEATIWASSWEIQPGPVSIGKALNNGRLFLIDENGEPVTDDSSGEICIAGDGLAEGYWQQDSETSKSFQSIQLPTDNHEIRMCKTGDLGQLLPSGEISFLGRNDKQVKFLGHRIELEEIESVLRNIDGIVDAICVLDPHGEIVAVAKQHAQYSGDIKDIRSELARCLPDAMQPVALALSESFPMTVNGKLDVSTLVSIAKSNASVADTLAVAAHSPTDSKAGLKSADETKPAAVNTSMDGLQEIVKQIWTDTLLSEPADETVDFFDAGGNSLRAMVLSSRLRERLQCNISVRTIFDSPRFCDLVSVLASEAGAVIAEKSHSTDVLAPGPISSSQARLWLVEKIVPGSAAYNMSMPLELNGPISLNDVANALDKLIQRHDALRMSFTEKGGITKGRYAEHATFELEKADLSSYPEHQSFDMALSAARDYARLSFDLEIAPLFRAKIWKIGSDRHLLQVILHHIICDGWSLAVLLREFSELLGDPEALSNRPMFQYQEYVEHERRALVPERRKLLLDYWKTQLNGSPPPLEMPIDFTRPEVEEYSGKVSSYTLPIEMRENISALAKAEGTATFTILQSALACVLGRITGRRDIRMGSDIAGRQTGVPSDAVGLFVNQVVLKTILDESISFEQLIRNNRDTLLDAIDHADLPFNELVDELAPTRDLGRNPLFQIGFNFQEVAKFEMADRPNLTLTRIPLDIEISRIDLEINANRSAEGLQIEMVYNDQLFRPESIDRLFSTLTSLLAAAVDNPQAPVLSLPIISADEKLTLESGFNCRWVEFDKRCPSEIVRSFAIQTPDALAIADAETRWNYAELEKRVNELASGLMASGVGKRSIVATYIHRSPYLPVAMLALWRLGATYQPLEPSQPASRVKQVLKEANVDLVLTTMALDSALDSMVDNTKKVTIEAIAQESESISQLEPYEDLPAYVLFTSGSTGTPKGAIVLHKGMSNHLGAKVEDLSLVANDCLAQTAPLTFDISIWQFIAPLMVGGSVHVCDDDTVRDPSLLVATCESEQVTVLETVPSFLNLLIENTKHSDDKAFTHLRILMSTGEALPADLCHRWFAEFPSIPLVNAYGPTECSDDVTHHVMTEAPSLNTPVIPIGRPISNTRLYVLDEFGELCAMGAVGELCVSGVAVGGGYLNNPAATTANFGPDPFSNDTSMQMYRTGDLVRWNLNGELEYLGRIDSQVKVRGCRIELSEIETVLNQNPMVKSSVVKVFDDFNNQQRLAAYVVADWHVVETELKDQLDSDREEEWRSVYDFYYQSSAESSTDDNDPTFNTTGWTDSVTDTPIPSEQMRDWLNQAVDRMKRFKPRRVLEIGCGTGMVAYQLAGECEYYLGVDFSPPVVNRLREQISELRPSWKHVQIEHGAAHDVGSLTQDGFDLIIMNSVVQYFPSAEYLKGVLQDAVAKLAPGGKIYLGDVRSHELQRTFHLAITAAREPEQNRAEIIELAETALMRDKELTLAEGFFKSIVEEELMEGRSLRFATWLKTGPFDNELTRYRFDMAFVLDGDAQPATPDSRDWATFNNDLSLLDKALAQFAEQGLLVTGVPNERLAFFASLGLEGSNRTEHGDTSFSVNEFDQLAQSHGLLMQSRFGDNPFYMDIYFQPTLLDWPAIRRPGAQFSEPFRGQAMHAVVRHVQEWVRGRLPDFMVPHSVTMLEQMPLTDHGKIDLKALPQPRVLDTSGQDATERPRTEMESVLTQVWCNVLGVNSVGLRDNFFDMGGDSILSIQVVSAAAREGLRLTPKQIFQHMTIAELAAVAETSSQVVEIRAVGVCPLSPLQADLLNRNLDAPNHWNQAIFVAGQILNNFEETRAALDSVLAHHDAMRLRFQQVDGIWQQEYVNVIIPFELDLVESYADFTAVAAKLNTSLSLSEGPLIRGALLLGDRPTLLLVAHHLMIDAVSWRILLEDVETALKDKAGASEPYRTAGFRTWVENMVALAETRSLRTHLSYWLEQSRIGEAHPIAGSATGRPMATKIMGGALSAEQSKRVLELKNGQVIEEVLLAGLVVCLSDSSKWNDVVVCCEGHGRDIFPDLDVSRTMGWFAIAFPMRLRLPRDENAVEDLQYISRQVRTAKSRSHSYDILRTFDPDKELRQSLLDQPEAELRFNYFGRVSRGTVEHDLLAPIEGDAGALQGASDLPQYALDVAAIFNGESLSIYWTIEESLLDPDFVSDIAAAYPAALDRMLDALLVVGPAGEFEQDMDIDDAEFAAALEEIAE